MFNRLIAIFVFAGLLFLFWTGTLCEIVTVVAVMNAASVNVFSCTIAAAAMFLQATVCYNVVKGHVTKWLDGLSS